MALVAQNHTLARALAAGWSKVAGGLRTSAEGVTHEDDSENYDAYPRWPVMILAAGAFVAIWGGWVDLGRMAGFGPVNLLPGITELTVDLSITLPLGMEVYAAYALGVWLTHRHIRQQARNFAGWSVLASLVIGALGQVAYHLLRAAHVDHAPTPVVVAVACIPVAVVGMGAALSHLLATGRTHRPLGQPLVQAGEPAIATVIAGPPAVSQPQQTPPAQSVDQPAVSHGPRPTPAAVEPQPALAALAAAQPPARVVATVRSDEGQRAMSIEERDELILRLARDATSERELAAQTPWSRSTVNRVLRAHNVTLPLGDDLPDNEPADGQAREEGPVHA